MKINKISNLIKENIRNLQYGPFAKIIGILASIHQTIKYKSFVHIYRDKDGDWVNCRKEVTFIAPSLHAVCYDEINDYVLNGWCFDYMAKKGDTIIDIGAGIGDDVFIFSKLVGSNGVVIAIEAHPKTFNCLVKTIQINKLVNVIPLNIATSDTHGWVEMCSDDSYLNNRIIKNSIKNKITIECKKLDEIIKNLNITNIDLMKMNIEGAETLTLNGATQTLKITRNIVVSCHDFIADSGGESSFRTYDDCKLILEKSNFDLMGPRAKTKPWFPYYLHGRNIKKFL